MRKKSKKSSLEDWQKPDPVADALLLVMFLTTPFFLASVGGLWVAMRFYDASRSPAQPTTVRKVA